jgi:hypothetical protein
VTPRKVLILGDSLAATGFGALLEKKLDAHPHIECFRKAKSATGLARPDFYDWQSEAKKQIEARQARPRRRHPGRQRRAGPAAEVGQGQARRLEVGRLERGLQGARRGILEGPRRAQGAVAGAAEVGARELRAEADDIRQVQSEAVATLGASGTYVETTPMLSDEQGELLEKATVGRHKNQTLREEDGIHFTMAGSEFLADKVYPEVLRVLGVEDVVPEPKPAKKKR